MKIMYLRLSWVINYPSYLRRYARKICLISGRIQSIATEVRFANFLSGGFTTMAVMNPPEKKLENAPLCIATLEKKDPRISLSPPSFPPA